MMYNCNLIVFFLIFSTSLFAQDEATLIPVLENIKSELQEVQGKSDSYSQELVWDDEVAYKLQFTQVKTTSKGKSEEMVYSFNLRDIDKNTIKVKNDKDLMKVPLFMDNRQKLVKYFKDGKQDKYIDKIELLASDVDNARKLEELFEEAVAIASKIKPLGLPESFDDRMNWLLQNVIAINIDETTYNQILEKDDQLPLVFHYTLTKQGKKTTEQTWHFNIADLKDRTVQLKIKGKEVFVEMQTTRSLKFIEKEKDGKPDGFTNKLVFYVDEPDKGKMVVDILKGLIPQYEEKEKARFPEINDLQSGLDLLAEHTTNLEAGGKTYTQSINPECVTTLTREGTDSKGKSSEKQYLFNLADLNDNKVNIKVTSKQISLELETDKNKLIQSFKDGEMQNYSNKVSILAKDIENAKWLLHTLPQTIKFCEAENSNKDLAIKGAVFDWIKENITEVAGLQQNVDKTEDECKWQFITTKTGKKGSTEETYEFNLSDLNPKSIDFKISGKTLSVQIYTRHNEKNIKYYKNGEPGDYKNNFVIRMDNVEKARQMIKIWKEQIGNCGE